MPVSDSDDQPDPPALDDLPDAASLPPLATPTPFVAPAAAPAPAAPGVPVVPPGAVVPLAPAPTWKLPAAPLVVVTEHDPECSAIAVTRQEITASAWQRPEAARVPAPHPGQQVLFRMHRFGDLTDALVVSVQDMTRPGPDPDPMVWRRDNVTGLVCGLHADPWPSVVLDSWWGRIRTREARVRGSEGWVPAGWDPPRPDPARLAAYR
jgi:hypothetical protein